MKLKELEALLSSVSGFEKPKVELEQYPTSAHLAARLVYTAANSFDDIEDKIVVDLGCGSGMLTVASALAGAAFVYGVDVDPDALVLANAHVEQHGLEDVVDLIQSNISCTTNIFSPNLNVDTVIMNPPFGTRLKGADILFLNSACELANTVYSMHKTSTRDYVVRKAQSWGFETEVIAQMRFDIPKSYKFHTKRSVDVDVDLIRLSR